MHQHAGAKIACGFVAGQNSSHLLHILGGFVGQNVHSVVDGHNAHHQVFAVQHGHGGKVVALHFPGHKLFVVGHLHGDHIFVHDIGDLFIQIGQHQVFGAHNADQLVLFHHKAGVHGFGVFAVAANGIKCLRNGVVPAQAHIFGGHDAARRILGVVEQLVQAVPGLFTGFFQNALHNAGRHILQKVGRIVQTHLFQCGAQLGIAESLHHVGAHIGIKIREHLGGHAFAQQAKRHQAVVFVHVLQDLGQVYGLHLLGGFAQLAVLAL